MSINNIDTTIFDASVGDFTEVDRSYSSGPVALSTYRWDGDFGPFGSNNARVFSIQGHDSNGTYLWGYHIYTNDDVGTSPASVSFVDGSPPLYEEIEDADPPFTTLSKFTDHQIRLRDPSSALAFELNGTQQHTAGTGYPATDFIRFRVDDSAHRVVAGSLQLSTLVFEEGSAVKLGNASQAFVSEEVAEQFVNDSGNSSFVFIDGAAIGRDT